MSREPLVQRFWSSVSVAGPDDCWEWSGRRDEKGYGIFLVCGKHVRAHRLSFDLSTRNIPNGGWVLHRCDNPPCVNPAHLFLGDNLANVRDRMLKGRQSPNCKLTLEVASQILDSPLSAREASSKFGVSKTTVCRLRRGDHWAREELGR